MTYDPQSEVDVHFGGNDGGISQSRATTDTYDAGTDTWTTQFPATSPPARDGATMDYDAQLGKSVLFGGTKSGEDSLDDTWTYDAGTDAWVKQSPPTSPPDRRYASMAYDAGSGKIVLFGGSSPGNGLRGDTWIYGPLPHGRCQRQQVTIKAVPGARVTYGTPHRDVILGNSAANKISGLGGSDLICGAGGNDTISGGSGNDTIAGQGGSDVPEGRRRQGSPPWWRGPRRAARRARRRHHAALAQRTTGSIPVRPIALGPAAGILRGDVAGERRGPSPGLRRTSPGELGGGPRAL